MGFRVGSLIGTLCIVFCIQLLTASPSFGAHADGFVFPVLAAGHNDPVTNTTDPLGHGWTGHGVGWNDAGDDFGHLGQDYYLTSGCSQENEVTVGNPVFAAANGIVVQVVNNSDTAYGWHDEYDHGWGRVITP